MITPHRQRQAAATTLAMQTASTGQKRSRFSVCPVQADAAGVVRRTAFFRMATTTMQPCGSTTRLIGAAGVKGTADHHQEEQQSSDLSHETVCPPNQWRGLCDRCHMAGCSHARTHAASAAAAGARCWTMRIGFQVMNNGCKIITMCASSAHGMRLQPHPPQTQARPTRNGTHNRHPDAGESTEAVAATNSTRSSTA
jgi:hypothetical protein